MEPAACPHCAAVNPPGALTCWLCQQRMEARTVPPGRRTEASPNAAAAQRTFGLSSLMLLIVLIAVCLGVMREVPGLGIGLLLLATPAAVRTAIASSRREARGEPMRAAQWLWAFASSLGVVIVIGVASVAAFSGLCFAGVFIGDATHGLGDPYAGLAVGLFIGGGIGLLLAIYVFYRLARWLWPIRN